MASPDVMGVVLEFIRPVLQTGIWEYARKDKEFARMFKIFKNEPPLPVMVMTGLREAFGLVQSTNQNKEMSEFLLGFGPDMSRLYHRLFGDDYVEPDVMWRLMGGIIVNPDTDRVSFLGEDDAEILSFRQIIERIKGKVNFQFAVDICLVKLIATEIYGRSARVRVYEDILTRRCANLIGIGANPKAFDHAIFFFICEIADHPMAVDVLKTIMQNTTIWDSVLNDQTLLQKIAPLLV